MSNQHTEFLKLLFEDNNESRKRMFRSFKAKADAKRTALEKLADWATSIFGNINFLLLNVTVFVFWVLINTNQIQGIAPFDPFPFSLLTTAVSLEAIILAIFVLISQNRNIKIDDLREETHLQLNLIAEKEITKVIKMLAILLERQGVDLSKDPELKKMIRPVSEEEIERRLEKEIL